MFKVGDKVRRRPEFINEAFYHCCEEAGVNPDLNLYTVASSSRAGGIITLVEADLPEFTWTSRRWELYDISIEANE